MWLSKNIAISSRGTHVYWNVHLSFILSFANVNISCLSARPSKGTYQKVLMGTETSLHGNSDIPGLASLMLPGSLKKWLVGMRNMLHGRMCKELGVFDSFIQCPIWKCRQGVHLVINSHRDNEWGISLRTRHVRSVPWFYIMGDCWEIQAKMPALSSSELPFFSSSYFWWTERDLGLGWGISLKPGSKNQSKPSWAQCGTADPWNVAEEGGGARAHDGARGRFLLRTDSGVWLNKSNVIDQLFVSPWILM